MPVKFHDLKVSKITRETEDTISVSFDIPDDIAEEFYYLPGQYLTLKLKEDRPDNRRAYSISSSPYFEEPITVTIKKAAEGFMSKKLHDELKEGDILEVLPPFGRFTVEPSPRGNTDYVMIGAGSGITPLISMIKSVLRVEAKSRILLIYQNRNEESIIFKGLLESLAGDYPNLKIFHILSRPAGMWEGPAGKITGEHALNLIREHLGKKIADNEYFVCGPPAMMQDILQVFTSAGIDESRIHREMFTAPLPEPDEETGSKKEEKPALIKRTVKIKLYGDINSFVVEPDETITQAAMREGLEPPFSCQIGACSTCRAKTMSGEVMMDESEALTAQEIKDGYVLTCQAHPTTDNVFIDFDF